MRFLVALVAACGLQDVGGGSGFTLFGIFDEVYQCTSSASVVEVCWDRDVSTLEDDLDATCEPTPRHLGTCIYSCSSKRGCNALNGCYCP